MSATRTATAATFTADFASHRDYATAVIAKRMGRHPADPDVQDAVSAALASVWRALEEGRFDATKGEIRGYLHRAAVNAATDSIRGRRPVLTLSQGLNGEGNGRIDPIGREVEPSARLEEAEDATAQETEAAQLRALVDALPERERVIIRAFMAGRLMTEVAEELGTSPQRVHQLKVKALEALRAAL
jgi:RNA polymerase sigma factor (sigma-70 family)